MLNNFLGGRERDRDRHRDRQTDRQTDRGGGCGGGGVVDRFTLAMSPKYAILYNKNDFISYHLHQWLGW